jgi:inner membrane protein
VASLGHVAVGMAAARLYDRPQPLPSTRSIALLSALSMLPDADIIGMALGVAYVDPWGHRGATHSFVFAAAIGLAVGIVMRARNRRWLRASLAAAAVVATHPILDTLTDGGLGCALFWPFDNTRYFAPWRPIPVAPIGLDYFSFYGMVVAITETVLFGPLFVYALWPFRNAR